MAAAGEYYSLVREFLEDSEWSSVFEAALLLFNGLCGYAVVIAPFAAKQLGIIHGLWLLATLALALGYTARTLLSVAEDQRVGSYATVAEKAFGTRGFLAASLCQLLFCLVSLSFMLNIVADVAPPLLDAPWASGIYQEDPLDDAQHEDDDHVIDFLAHEAYPPSDTQRFTSLLVAAVVAMPFCLNYQLRSLRNLGYVTFYSLVPILVLVFLRSFAGRPTDDLGDRYGEGWYEPRTLEGFFKSLGVLCFGVTSQHQVFAVYACLRRRSVSRFHLAARRATSLACLIFAYLTILGYCTFGRYLQPTLFSGYAVNELTASPISSARRLDTLGEPAAFTWSNYVMRLLAAVVVMTSYPANMLIARQAACQFAQRIQEVCCPQRTMSIDSGSRLSFSEAYATRWAADEGGVGQLERIADSLESAGRRQPKQNAAATSSELPTRTVGLSKGDALHKNVGREHATSNSQSPLRHSSGEGAEAAKEGNIGDPLDTLRPAEAHEDKRDTDQRVLGLHEPLLPHETNLEYDDWAAALEDQLKGDPDFERLSQASAESATDGIPEKPRTLLRVARYAHKICASSCREVRQWRRHKWHIVVTSGIHLAAVVLGMLTIPTDLELIGGQASVLLSLILPACVYLKLGLVSDYGAVAICGVPPQRIGMGALLVLGLAISVMLWYAHIVLWSRGAQ